MQKGYIFLSTAIIISILLTLSLLIVLAVNLTKIQSVVSDSDIMGPLKQLNSDMQNFQSTMNKNIKDTNQLLRTIISELREIRRGNTTN